MESDWQELHQVQLPSSEYDTYGTSPNVGTIAFDTHQELLWVGDNHGHINSYYSANLENYTSTQAHAKDEGPVKQFLFDKKAVFSLASRSIHSTVRRGLTVWHTTHPLMKDLSCMIFLDRSSSILVAGNQEIMLKISAANGQVVQETKTPSKYVMMKYCRYICAATFSGSVDFLDPESLVVLKQWQAQTSGFSGIDAKSDFLVTCGWTQRNFGALAPDPIAKVFDLKKMEQAPPISFPAGAAFVQIHPKMSTTCVIGSRSGQLQVVDMMNANTSNIRYLPSQLDDFIMSPSGNIWILVDQLNVVHVWGAIGKLAFNENPDETEFADDAAPVPYLDVDSDSPFSTIGMPFYKDRLLSAWGNDQIFETGKPLLEIDHEIEANLKQTRYGRVAPNPGKAHRNQISQAKVVYTNGNSSVKVKSQAPDALGYYNNVKIIYGNFGIKDFDFQLYNQTLYSGLEADIEDSFLNPLLQLLKYTPFIRNLALTHVAGKCLDFDCLFCEAGFLFDMLEKAEGVICRAKNLLKMYGILHGQVTGETALDMRLAKSTAMIIAQLVSDSYRVQDGATGILDKGLKINGELVMKCTNCGNETRRMDSSYLLNLWYPDLTSISRRHAQKPSFSEILSQSFSALSQKKGRCNFCRSYPFLSQRRVFRETPAALIINALPESNHDSGHTIWSTPGFLPESIGIYIYQDGRVVCIEDGVDQIADRVQVYDLVGFVAQIHSSQDQKSHLVSLINVEVFEDKTGQSRWHLFNDFAVQEIEKEDALSFNPSWKTPVILIYQARPYRKIDDSWKVSLDPICLWSEGSLDHRKGFPLRPTEEMQDDFHLAIDAEFVKVQNEEYEITLDGERKIVRPARLTPGRVSALRIGGMSNAVPFMDDYIRVTEPIVNYETKYSGLEHGDLDSTRSPYVLQPLKVVYKKLWLLLNLGCTFVGHGLDSDFRVLNIFVPESQVVDTVKLFHKPEAKRFVSLRFLAWYFLKDDSVQTGNHDSIIDAHTALRLWRKYEDFVAEGTVARELKALYRAGPQTDWLPPAEYQVKMQGLRTAAAALAAAGAPGAGVVAAAAAGGLLGVLQEHGPGSAHGILAAAAAGGAAGAAGGGGGSGRITPDLSSSSVGTPGASRSGAVTPTPDGRGGKRGHQGEGGVALTMYGGSGSGSSPLR